jgi:hypothetical protein
MTVATASTAPRQKPPKLSVWPMVLELVRPRQGMLFLGLGLMAINRVSGLVLPWSTKSLIDDVIGKREAERLLPLVGGVVVATLIQGATSFTLTPAPVQGSAAADRADAREGAGARDAPAGRLLRRQQDRARWCRGS